MESLECCVAKRYLNRQAVEQVCGSSSYRNRTAALQNFTPTVLAAMAEGCLQGRSITAGLVGKLKELFAFFTKVPDVWSKFKEMLGIESLKDLPKAISKLFQKAVKFLQGFVDHLFAKWPLKIYTLDKGRLKGFNDLLETLIIHSPRLKQFMGGAKKMVDKVDAALREHVPSLSIILTAGIFLWIWWEVQEFEYDLKSFADVLAGRIHLSQLLASLPASGLGLLLNGLGFGTWLPLLAITVAVRILWMLFNRYIVWTGNGFEIQHELLVKDFSDAKHDLLDTLKKVPRVFPV